MCQMRKHVELSATHKMYKCVVILKRYQLDSM